MFEFFYKLPPEDRTENSARQTATEQLVTFSQENSDYTIWDPDDEQVKWFKQQAWSYIKSIWDIEDPADVEVVETEMDIETQMGSVPFRGIIDRVERINGELVISDYKTGKAPIRRFMAPKLAQVVLYAAVVNQTLTEAPKRARLLFLGDQVVSTTPSKASMNREVKALEKTWETIHWSLETDIFPTDPGPLCGWCPHVDICEDGQVEVKRRLAEGKLKPTAPAREILGLGGFTPTQ